MTARGPDLPDCRPQPRQYPINNHPFHLMAPAQPGPEINVMWPFRREVAAAEGIYEHRGHKTIWGT